MRQSSAKKEVIDQILKGERIPDIATTPESNCSILLKNLPSYIQSTGGEVMIDEFNIIFEIIERVDKV